MGRRCAKAASRLILAGLRWHRKASTITPRLGCVTKGAASRKRTVVKEPTLDVAGTVQNNSQIVHATFQNRDGGQGAAPARRSKIGNGTWDSQADDYVRAAERHWTQTDPTWGIWEVPESELQLLPDRLEGIDVIELGCGTAYVSAWLARLGAHPVAIDNSPRQLETAQRMQREHGIAFPLVLGNAEQVPYPDGSFDLAISEYGAAIWCDPYRCIWETARLLRTAGELDRPSVTAC